MFGYFRPYHSNLTNSEKRLFESYYCRICYCLRILGGQLARFFTTYDGAIYSMIIDLQTKSSNPTHLPCERFGTKNLKYFQNDEIGLKVARLSLISFGEKIRDDEIDKNYFKARLGSLLFKKTINKAKEAEPVIAENSYLGTEKINQLQDSNSDIMEIFAAYGDMAISTISELSPLTKESEELVRSISEWIFLVDMICDYDEDYKNGTYNGFKTLGYATFEEYFDTHYKEFLDIVNKISDRLMAAIMAVRDNSSLWNTLYKIIVNAVNTVIPNAIVGKDIEFHYFSDLFERIRYNKKMKKDIKRLKVDRHEES